MYPDSASGNCNKNEVKPSIKNILETNGHLPAAYWQIQGEHDFSYEAKCEIDNNHRAEILLFHICFKVNFLLEIIYSKNIFIFLHL